MLYRTEEVFDGTQDINDTHESHDFDFQVDNDVDINYPAIIIIGTSGVDYNKNRVALNDNFIGYLTPGKNYHIFVVTNRYGRLKKTGNILKVLSCDRWGDRKSVFNLNIDNFSVKNIDVCYKSK